MSELDCAPGKPGFPPTWTTGAKDMIFTTLGTSRIWGTLGNGILNEVYWPSTGKPQLRDLGFLVAKDGQWWEMKRIRDYSVDTPNTFELIPTVGFQAEEFDLTLEFSCDCRRDVVMIRYRLEGDGHRLYCLITPRLGGEGHDNVGWCDESSLFAQREDDALCLRAEPGFDRQSAGYVGRSDGWQDFQQHGSMTWTYRHAGPGNIALMGELKRNQGVLALGFAQSPIGAETLARSSLAEGFDGVRKQVSDSWRQWGKKWKTPSNLETKWNELVEHSAAVLTACGDRTFPGAVVASLSVPWGDQRDDLGGYHLMWPRDAVQSALGNLAIGHVASAKESAAYLNATQQADGHWLQNSFPDGRPYWDGIQLDETAFPVLLVAKLRELDALQNLHGVESMVQRALHFLLRAGPVTPLERWENKEGISVFTLCLIISAIVGGCEFLESEEEKEYLLSYADFLNRRIEDWLYIQETELTKKYEVDGYYLRLAPTRIFQEPSKSSEGVGPPLSTMVALDFAYLARMGLRAADNSCMLNTLKVVDGEIRVETPSGPTYHRYQGDKYGEAGAGRGWPLLTGERGHYALMLGEDVAPYLDAMWNMTSICGLLPEQVWDSDPIPEQNLFPGKPTGSAMPLLWAHSEFMKLAAATTSQQPVELLAAVRNRYHAQRPDPSCWHWRSYAPFAALPEGKDLIIESTEPFTLHLGFDDWEDAEDRDSEPLPAGQMHGVRIQSAELLNRSSLNFTMYYQQQQAWEKGEHTVELTQQMVKN